MVHFFSFCFSIEINMLCKTMMAHFSAFPLHSSPLLSVSLTLLFLLTSVASLGSSEFSIDGDLSSTIMEATVGDLQLAFSQNRLTSLQLTEFYIARIRRLNPLLRSVIEVNPDAIRQAREADRQRRIRPRGGLHGIVLLLKDNIATEDRMNTTAGSLALVGSVVARDAGVVARLRKAGAVILGKASLSEWAHFRDQSAPSGWCARSGQGKNPYNLKEDPCGSSSGSAISAAANLAAVTLGTETDGSILCPSSRSAVVGIKPTVGLSSRGGVIPISQRQDTVGPICRTVSDAVEVLDVIAGFDPYDAKATREASRFIPRGGYKQFLRPDGLKGKRLGIVRSPFYSFPRGSLQSKVFQSHYTTLRKGGAILVDNLVIDDSYLNSTSEMEAILVEFKVALNAYLEDLVSSPVRSLESVIAFNNRHKAAEKIEEYKQQLFELAQMTNGTDDPEYRSFVEDMAGLNRDRFVKLMKMNKLDAVVAVDASLSGVLAIGGHPGITVPAGYDSKGVPVGICFGGLRGSEPKLIEIAYGFEQATKIRRPPPLFERWCSSSCRIINNLTCL